MGLVKKCRHVRAGKPPNRCGCTWYADHYDAAGRRRYERVGPDREAARARHAQLVANSLAGRLAPASASDTFAQVALRWIRLNENRGLSPSSVLQYHKRQKALDTLVGALPVQAIGTETVDELLKALTRNTSARYGQTLYGQFRAVMKLAAAEGLIERVPEPYLAPRWNPDRKLRVTPADLWGVRLTLADHWAGSLAEFILHTGLRIGEALALTDRSLSGRTLHVAGGKTGARSVTLTPRAVEIASERGTGRLWAYSQPGARDALRKAASGWSWHEFRHGNATLRRASPKYDMHRAAAEMGHTPNEHLSTYGGGPVTEEIPDALRTQVVDALAALGL